MRKSIPLAFAILLAIAATPASARTYTGHAVSIGHGSAWSVVQVDARNRPVAYGLQFTATALTGLPAGPTAAHSSPEWPNVIAFPSNAPATGFDHVNMDWESIGHPPPGIYTVPHFDFHFYTISSAAQMAIRYPHPGSSNMAGVATPAPALLPDGYMIPPGTDVNGMGLHALPANAPELHGGHFTSTMLYGYGPRGALIFFEPMIALSYLRTRPNAGSAIAVPASYSSPGYYPQHYSLSYDAHRKLYTLLLTGLRPWHVSQLARR